MMLLRYFTQNRDLLRAIRRAKQTPGDYDEVFAALLGSRLWFVLSGDPEDRESYEYLHYASRGDFVAAYTSLWHARRTSTKGWLRKMEIEFRFVFELTNG